MTPERFGTYWLVERIGEGGMGAVYIARRDGIADVVGSERLCVIKTMLVGSENEPGVLARFMDEARLVTRLNHKNICPVLDVGRVAGRPYVAMELVAGVDAEMMFHRLQGKQRATPANIALYIINETLEALDYAHRLTDPATGERLGVVHRDVSPHNVMVTFEGEVRLIDFGIAKSTLQREITEKDLVLGKLKYMAPEQARGQPVDARSDIYAVGVMLYELLSGHRFFEGHGDDELFQLLPKGGFLPAGLAQVAAPLRAIIERALESDPARRYATCADMLAALDVLPERRDPGAGRALARLLADELHDEQELISARLARASAFQPAQAAAAMFDDTTAVVVPDVPFVADIPSVTDPDVPDVPDVANVADVADATNVTALTNVMPMEDVHTQPTAVMETIARLPSETIVVRQRSATTAPARRSIGIGAAVAVGVVVALLLVAVALKALGLIFPTIEPRETVAPVTVAPVEVAVEVVPPVHVVEDATLVDAGETDEDGDPVDAGEPAQTPVAHRASAPRPPKPGNLRQVIKYLAENCRPVAPCASPLLKKRGTLVRMDDADRADFVHDADQCARACFAALDH